MMNEQIREIVDAVRFTREIPYPGQDEIFQRVAELIILECAKICEHTADKQLNSMFRRESDGAIACSYAIKEHFGIK
jgi:hypothetical protein